MSKIEVILPDNSKIELEENANGFSLASKISEGLAKNAVALEINGEMKDIRTPLSNNDHVKIYKKRPIYWLFDSGKKNGFKALIYMHRYNENLVPKIRLDYLHRMQTTYEKLLSDINYKLTTELSMTDKKEAQKRQADLNAKLQEIKEYDEKIAHIANQRISIDLDDGVKVNYEKFKDMSQTELFDNLMQQVAVQKEKGTFDYKKLEEMVNSLQSGLPKENFENIKRILERLK